VKIGGRFQSASLVGNAEKLFTTLIRGVVNLVRRKPGKVRLHDQTKCVLNAHSHQFATDLRGTATRFHAFHRPKQLQPNTQKALTF
jgi:hypothetical protein